MYSNIFISLIPFFIFCPQSFKKPWGQVRTVQLILVEKSYLVTYALFGSVHNGISVRFGQSQNFYQIAHAGRSTKEPRQMVPWWLLDEPRVPQLNNLTPSSRPTRPCKLSQASSSLFVVVVLSWCLCQGALRLRNRCIYLTHQHWITETIF